MPIRPTALLVISKAHQLANVKDDPAKHLVVKETMKGIRRHHLRRRRRQLARSLWEWTDWEDLDIKKGLTDQVVRTVVKERARAAGLEEFERLSGHWLRAGLATQAALNGANLRDIAKQTGHRSEKILSGYIRDADLWRNNVTESLGF